MQGICWCGGITPGLKTGMFTAEGGKRPVRESWSSWISCQAGLGDEQSDKSKVVSYVDTIDVAFTVYSLAPFVLRSIHPSTAPSVLRSFIPHLLSTWKLALQAHSIALSLLLPLPYPSGVPLTQQYQTSFLCPAAPWPAGSLLKVASSIRCCLR